MVAELGHGHVADCLEQSALVSISSIAASSGSMVGFWPSKSAGVLRVDGPLELRNLAGDLPKFAVVEVFHGLNDFVLSVHDERSVTHNGLTDGFTA